MVTCNPLSNVCKSVLAVSLLAASAQADWMDTFNGSFDQSWTFAGVNQFGLPSPPTQLSQDLSNNQLDLNTSLSPLEGGPLYHFGWVNETFTDARMTAWATGKNSYNDLSLVLRGNPATLQGYSLSVDDDVNPNNPRGLLSLNSFSGLTFTTLALARIPDYITSVDDYFLEFVVNGNTLTGRAWSDATRTNLLAAVQTTDNTYTSGVAALSATSIPTDDGFVSASFDDVTVTAVPEPSSAVLLLSVGAIGIWRRRRRA